jgi:hypothetical protein
VPPQSSTLGDKRERAETINANHITMCKFWGREDPGYDQVGGELKTIVDQIVKDEAAKADVAATAAEELQS